jgi:hypothetical protein
MFYVFREEIDDSSKIVWFIFVPMFDEKIDDPTRAILRERRGCSSEVTCINACKK